MPLGPSGRRNEPLNVFWMALALVGAATVGAVAGLIWHASGFGGDEEAAVAEAQPAS